MRPRFGRLGTVWSRSRCRSGPGRTRRTRQPAAPRRAIQLPPIGKVPRVREVLQLVPRPGCCGRTRVRTARQPSHPVARRMARFKASSETARPPACRHFRRCPQPELEGVVAFVRLLNPSSTDTRAAGDAAAGARFFFGAGQCASCHIVAGRGAAIGPDLSNVGSRE